MGTAFKSPFWMFAAKKCLLLAREYSSHSRVRGTNYIPELFLITVLCFFFASAIPTRGQGTNPTYLHYNKRARPALRAAACGSFDRMPPARLFGQRGHTVKASHRTGRPQRCFLGAVPTLISHPAKNKCLTADVPTSICTYDTL